MGIAAAPWRRRAAIPLLQVQGPYPALAPGPAHRYRPPQRPGAGAGLRRRVFASEHALWGGSVFSLLWRLDACSLRELRPVSRVGWRGIDLSLQPEVLPPSHAGRAKAASWTFDARLQQALGIRLLEVQHKQMAAPCSQHQSHGSRRRRHPPPPARLPAALLAQSRNHDQSKRVTYFACVKWREWNGRVCNARALKSLQVRYSSRNSFATSAASAGGAASIACSARPEVMFLMTIPATSLLFMYTLRGSRGKQSVNGWGVPPSKCARSRSCYGTSPLASPGSRREPPLISRGVEQGVPLGSQAGVFAGQDHGPHGLQLLHDAADHRCAARRHQVDLIAHDKRLGSELRERSKTGRPAHGERVPAGQACFLPWKAADASTRRRPQGALTRPTAAQTLVSSFCAARPTTTPMPPREATTGPRLIPAAGLGGTYTTERPPPSSVRQGQPSADAASSHRRPPGLWQWQPGR